MNFNTGDSFAEITAAAKLLELQQHVRQLCSSNVSSLIELMVQRKNEDGDVVTSFLEAFLIFFDFSLLISNPSNLICIIFFIV